MPRVASVLSAWGMLASDIRYEISRTHIGDSAAMDELPLFPWNTTPKYHYIEVTPTQITGRRFVAEGRR